MRNPSEQQAAYTLLARGPQAGCWLAVPDLDLLPNLNYGAAGYIMEPTIKGSDSMSKTVLRAVAAILILAAAGMWLAAGANCGWTKTSVPVKRTDEVTGITVDDYQRRFVPGVDFLGAALLGSGILAAASFLFRTKQPQS